MAITLDGTNGVTASSPATVKASAYLDAAGGNTATINGKLPIALADIPASGSMTLLGTMDTTSGGSHTLSGLNLTGYTFVRLFWKGVSPNSSNEFMINNVLTGASATGGGNIFNGVIDIELSTGYAAGTIGRGSTVTGAGCLTGYSTASTSINVSTNGGSFDAGSISVYGVK